MFGCWSQSRARVTEGRAAGRCAETSILSFFSKNRCAFLADPNEAISEGIILVWGPLT